MRALGLSATVVLASVLQCVAPSVLAQVPTPEQYVAHIGGDAKLVPSGQLTLDGRRMICGQRPTVLDPTLDDSSAAYPGFIILNPTRMGRMTSAVKYYVYSQACGYQFRGPDADVADCFAIQRGRREGWLTPDGLDEICAFMSRAKGDPSQGHRPGPERCERMRACYTDPVLR